MSHRLVLHTIHEAGEPICIDHFVTPVDGPLARAIDGIKPIGGAISFRENEFQHNRFDMTDPCQKLVVYLFDITKNPYGCKCLDEFIGDEDVTIKGLPTTFVRGFSKYDDDFTESLLERIRRKGSDWARGLVEELTDAPVPEAANSVAVSAVAVSAIQTKCLSTNTKSGKPCQHKLCKTGLCRIPAHNGP